MRKVGKTIEKAGASAQANTNAKKRETPRKKPKELKEIREQIQMEPNADRNARETSKCNLGEGGVEEGA